jgi:hypothetical protein
LASRSAGVSGVLARKKGIVLNAAFPSKPNPRGAVRKAAMLVQVCIA